MCFKGSQPLSHVRFAFITNIARPLSPTMPPKMLFPLPPINIVNTIDLMIISKVSKANLAMQ